MENLGTLTIRREFDLPDPYDFTVGKFHAVTVATYRDIPQEACVELIEEFCGRNKMSRREVRCLWTQTVRL